MKRNWEVCPHSETGTRWSSFYVTMNTKGYISLSKYTFDKLGEPEHVCLLYDRPTNTIGLDPTGRMTKDAFHVSRKGSGGRVVYALRLIQEFNLKIPYSVRFMTPAIDDDGILILDLNNTRPARHGQNGRVPRRAPLQETS